MDGDLSEITQALEQKYQVEQLSALAGGPVMAVRPFTLRREPRASGFVDIDPDFRADRQLEGNSAQIDKFIVGTSTWDSELKGRCRGRRWFS